MPLIESSLVRENDTSGSNVKTYVDGTTHIQAMGIADDLGDQMGTALNPLKIAHAEKSLYHSQAAESSKLVKGTAGKFWSVGAILDPAVAAPRYLFIYNNTSATGTIKGRVVIPVTGQGVFEFRTGRSFTIGLFVALSTTFATYTAAPAGEAVFDVEYE